MKLKDYPKEELELMGYDDLAALVLEESGKKLKITDLFQKICQVLTLPETEYESRIADFFELLSTDKKFIMLENGYWDLRTKHSPKIVIDDDEEEPVEENIDDEEETEEDIFYDTDDESDEEEDELQDLVVVDIDEEESSI